MEAREAGGLETMARAQSGVCVTLIRYQSHRFNNANLWYLLLKRRKIGRNVQGSCSNAYVIS